MYVFLCITFQFDSIMLKDEEYGEYALQSDEIVTVQAGSSRNNAYSVMALASLSPQHVQSSHQVGNCDQSLT